MNEHDFVKIQIDELLPQRPPFVMVSHLLHYDEVVTETSYDVLSGQVFIENNAMNASGLVENFAQTCAARIGYINKYILHKEVNIGFIGAVKTLTIHCLPKVGETIRTRIEVLSEQFGITLAKGEIRLPDNTLVAEGEMKIALSEMTV